MSSVVGTNSVARPLQGRDGGGDPKRGAPLNAAPRQQYLDLRASVHRKLLNRLNLEALAQADRSRAESEIRSLLTELLAEEGAPISLSERETLFGEIVDDVFGLGPLEPLLRDPSISDILVNTCKHVYVERGGQLERIPTSFQDDRHLLRVIDRIVVGEVRGEEALDMLQAMNTGHDGSLTTVHANTPRDALSRIETMIAMGATNLPERAMRQQISSAIQLVVQQTRLSDGTRKVTAVSEITGMEGDIITMQDIFVFEKMGVTQDGKVIGRFRATGVRPKCCERLKASGIHLPADMFEGVTEVR